MNVFLKRISTTDFGSFGVLLRNDIPLMVTLEPKIPIVPYGTYRCFKRDSPSRSYPVYEFESVPDRTYVQIHAGNLLKDTEGCILVGMGFGEIDMKPGIVQSRFALNKLFELYPEELIISVI